jgi:hypothetical protein
MKQLQRCCFPASPVKQVHGKFFILYVNLSPEKYFALLVTN